MEAVGTSETLALSELRRVTTQKTTVFIVTALRASNPTNEINIISGLNLRI
jgi:hypothetical protein